MSTNFFSSLSGKFDLNASMSSLYGDYNTIKSGAYGSLMKSYVNKVGNKSALNAYRETGSTATVADTASNSTSTASSTTTKSSSSAKKSNFLDSHFSSIKDSGTYYKSDLLKRNATEEATGTNVDTTV
ncbi:hypothetical protein [Butyrivibrio sp. FCS014]|uniref:hypothetical protein n=1 Tax=Butyrivibrio sp. FCS014 TaxID=1408304 RepID=UPI000463FFD5|nr:hypothetical protein [Butyrivibrio sp. FCS014]